MLEQTPSSGRVAPLSPATPLSLNMFFALRAPLSFSVQLAAEISGMTPASGQRPRCGLLGAAEATEAEVGWGGASHRVILCLQTWLEVASAAHQAVSSPGRSLEMSSGSL